MTGTELDQRGLVQRILSLFYRPLPVFHPPSPPPHPHPPTHANEAQRRAQTCGLCLQSALPNWIGLVKRVSRRVVSGEVLAGTETPGEGRMGKIKLFLPGLALHLICLRFHRLFKCRFVAWSRGLPRTFACCVLS